jgi:Spy/CpxP family protein refolding chaperone
MRQLMLLLPLLPAIALANPQMPEKPPCGDMPPPKHHMPMDGELPLPLFLHQINLTEKQQSEIKTLVKAHCAEIDAKLEDLRSIGIKIHRLSFSNDYSYDKIQELFDKADIIHRETALQRSRLDNAIFKLLTGEQQKKVQSQFED